MENIGEQFKIARERSGFTLEDVSQKTKLTVAILTAIEKEDFRKLPSPTYVIGFIRAYARFLKLDDKAIVTDYIQRYREASESTLDVSDNIVATEKEAKKKRLFFNIILIIIIIALSYLGFTHFYEPILKEKMEEEVVEVEIKKEIPEIALIGRYQKMMMDKKAPVEIPNTMIRIKVLKDVFVSVEEGENHVFSGVLKEGASESWESSGPLSLKVGIADAVQLYVKERDKGIIPAENVSPNILLIDGMDIKVFVPESIEE
ncbi:MAG: DUF4115 domain-containing protein [Candidatus Aureabacteria bacterium]|nr:DUF4115 domain-containing protein [Candidatus Auribacterota bacterium]